MTPRLRLALTHAATLALAGAGGFLASLLHIPLAWMIGAMLATAGANMAGTSPAAPAILRPVALIVLGTGLGQAFSAPVLGALASALPALIIAGLGAVISGALVSRFTARLAGIDTRTAYFSSVPGGIIVMVVLAARAGVSVPVVTLSQTIRMMLVVLIHPPLLYAISTPGGDSPFGFIPPPIAWRMIPPLFALTVAGALVLWRAGMANPWMMGPVFVSVGLALLNRPLSGVPVPLIDLAQVLMGATLGARLKREFLLKSQRLALASVASMIMVSLLCAALGAAVAWGFGLPLAACLLGTAPGGMPEMAITAKVLNLGVPLVLGFHLVRVLLCNLVVSPVFKAYVWAERKLGLAGGNP